MMETKSTVMCAKRADFLKFITKYMARANGFDRVTQKLQIIEGGDGHCTAKFKLETEDLNLYGGIHGGLTATLIDVTASLALLSKHKTPGQPVDLQVMYLKPAQKDDELIVKATTISADNQLAYIDCELRNNRDDSVVAKGTQTKYICGGRYDNL